MRHEDAKIRFFSACLWHRGVFGVARFCMGFLVCLSLCGLGSASFAQEMLAPSFADQSVSGSPKAHVRKSVHKNGNAQPTGPSASEESEKAARLAEGRKKFFEQSMGFDNGHASESPITMGGDGHGLSPAAGFKF
jgi:hypothetical protein